MYTTADIVLCFFFFISVSQALRTDAGPCFHKGADNYDEDQSKWILVPTQSTRTAILFHQVTQLCHFCMA
jgi:hypothetical protein